VPTKRLFVLNVESTTMARFTVIAGSTFLRAVVGKRKFAAKPEFQPHTRGSLPFPRSGAGLASCSAMTTVRQLCVTRADPVRHGLEAARSHQGSTERHCREAPTTTGTPPHVAIYSGFQDSDRSNARWCPTRRGEFASKGFLLQSSRPTRASPGRQRAGVRHAGVGKRGRCDRRAQRSCH